MHELRRGDLITWRSEPFRVPRQFMMFIISVSDELKRTGDIAEVKVLAQGPGYDGRLTSIIVLHRELFSLVHLLARAPEGLDEIS